MPTLNVTTLNVTTLADADRPTGLWAASLLVALARDETAGRRTPRLTEPGLATWQRWKGRLSSADLVALLFEDAAVLHGIPFDPARVGEALDPARLSSSVADVWLAALSVSSPASPSLTSPGPEYILEQARLLGLPTKLARSELHVVKSHQKVLELPGTGGQLVHHLVSTQADLTLQDNVVIACSTWQERTLAGIVALDRGAPHADFVHAIEVEDLKKADHPLRRRTFDCVVGLHPDKGGLFRAEDQLAIWFPGATLRLV